MKLLTMILGLSLATATSALAEDRTAEINNIIRQLKPAKTTTNQEVMPTAGPAHGLEVIVFGESDYVLSDYRSSIDFPVYFEYGSAKLTEKGRYLLDALSRAMKDSALAKHSYLVAGHTDATGSASYNLKLSQMRAEAVKSYLVEVGGIAPYRLITIGWGESRLKNAARPNAAVNRRVEVSFVSRQVHRFNPNTKITIWYSQKGLKKVELSSDRVAEQFPNLVTIQPQETPMPSSDKPAAVTVTIKPSQPDQPVPMPADKPTVEIEVQTPGMAPPQDQPGVISDDCANRVANDPRPNSNQLDDFNSGRTPLKCEDEAVPAPVNKDPVQGQGTTRIKIQ